VASLAGVASWSAAGGSCSVPCPGGAGHPAWVAGCWESGLLAAGPVSPPLAKGQADREPREGRPQSAPITAGHSPAKLRIAPVTVVVVRPAKISTKHSFTHAGREKNGGRNRSAAKQAKQRR